MYSIYYWDGFQEYLLKYVDNSLPENWKLLQHNVALVHAFVYNREWLNASDIEVLDQPATSSN